MPIFSITYGTFVVANSAHFGLTMGRPKCAFSPHALRSPLHTALVRRRDARSGAAMPCCPDSDNERANRTPYRLLSATIANCKQCRAMVRESRSRPEGRPSCEALRSCMVVICCGAHDGALGQTAVPTVVSPTPGNLTPVTSTTTNCMMACNARAASCQTGCFIPMASAVTPAGTVTLNPTASTACTMVALRASSRVRPRARWSPLRDREIREAEQGRRCCRHPSHTRQGPAHCSQHRQAAGVVRAKVVRRRYLFTIWIATRGESGGSMLDSHSCIVVQFVSDAFFGEADELGERSMWPTIAARQRWDEAADRRPRVGQRHGIAQARAKRPAAEMASIEARQQLEGAGRRPDAD